MYLVGQPPIQWQRCIGDINNDEGAAIQQTNDGGYIIAGHTATWGHGGNDFYIIKLNTGGTVVWQVFLGGTYGENPKSIIQTNDGGYVVAGRTFSLGNNGDVTGNHGSADFWVVKLSATGSLVWQKSLGGSDGEEAMSVVQATDGGYIVVGTTQANDGDVSGIHGSHVDYWVVKLTSAGQLQWQKTLGGTTFENANAVTATLDGGCVVAGRSNSTDGDVTANFGGDDAWLVKLDVAGNITWQKSIGGTYDEDALDIFQTSEGGYIFAGYKRTSNGFPNFWVVKTDSVANVVWEKIYGGIDVEVAYSVRPTNDGGYIVAGSAKSKGGDVVGLRDSVDFWLVKLDSAGNKEWQKCLGGARDEVAYGVRQTIDGEYIMIGTTESNNFDVYGNHSIQNDIWVVKTGYCTSVSSSFSDTVCAGQYYMFGSSYLTTTGTYIDTFATVIGCDSIVTLNLTVNQLPNVQLQGNPDTVCLNASALTITGESPAGGIFTGNGVTGNNFNPTVAGTGSHSITYTYSDNNNCIASATEVIVVDPCINYNCNALYTLYPDTVVPHTWWALNQSTGTGAITYTWYWGDGVSSVGDTASHNFAAPGYYNICLTISDSAGCTDSYCDSSTYIYKTESMISVNAVWEIPAYIPTGISNISTSASCYVYPNPANDYLNIQVSKNLKGATLNVYDVTGVILYSTQIESSHQSISIADYPSGIYITEVKLNNTSLKRRWAKL